jgi:hypothetical protein
MEGYTLTINFEVFIQNRNMSEDPIALQFIAYHLILKLRIGNDCGVCTTSVFQGNNSTSQLFFRYELFATEGCPHDTLLKKIRKIAIQKKKNLQFKYRNQEFNTLVSLVFENDRTSALEIRVDMVSAFCKYGTDINESILLYCPAIMLSNAEVNEFGPHKSPAHPQVQNANATTQQVCVDVYFSAQKNNSVVLVACSRPSFILTMILSIRAVLQCYVLSTDG